VKLIRGFLFMTNKRIIWLTIFLILCLVGGGVYYALSGESLPCKVICVDEEMTERLRFLVNYRYLTSMVKQYARQERVDLSTWDRVEVLYLKEIETWICDGVQPRSCSTSFGITNDGELIVGDRSTSFGGAR
jgi:hypothetical protein